MKTESPFKNAHEVWVTLASHRPSADFLDIIAAIELWYRERFEGKERFPKFGKVLNDHCFCIAFKVVDDAEFQEILAVLLAFGNDYEILEIIPFLAI